MTLLHSVPQTCHGSGIFRECQLKKLSFTSVSQEPIKPTDMYKVSVPKSNSRVVKSSTSTVKLGFNNYELRKNGGSLRETGYHYLGKVFLPF